MRGITSSLIRRNSAQRHFGHRKTQRTRRVLRIKSQFVTERLYAVLYWPYIHFLIFAAQLLPYSCWGRGGGTRSRITLLQPASIMSQTPLLSRHTKPSQNVIPSLWPNQHGHSSVCFSSPVIHSHPSCALIPVLIGKSVEQCQTKQWDTWSSVKTSFPVKQPPVLTQ